MNVKEDWESKGEWGQEALAQWTGIRVDMYDNILKTGVKPEEVAHKSGHIYRFTCSKGHIFKRRIQDRTLRMDGCPMCCRSNTSYAEQYLYVGLSQVFDDVRNRYLVDKEEYRGGLEFDIAITSKNTYIEYSPTRTHMNRGGSRDQLKIDYCKRNNIKLILIVEDTYNSMNEAWDEDYVCVYVDTRNKSNILRKILNHIISVIEPDSGFDVDYDEIEKLAWTYSHGGIRREQSLGYKYPNIVAEWHINNNIDPFNIMPNSHERIMWQCTKCGYGSNGEWITSPCNRVQYKSGCRKCGFNWFAQRIVNHKHPDSSLRSPATQEKYKKRITLN